MRLAGLVGGMVLGASSLLAQVVGGSLGGTVTDASGAAVRGAKVVIRNAETGTERTLVTGADGRYAAPSLPVGAYNVVVTGMGLHGLNGVGWSSWWGRVCRSTWR